MAKMYAWSVFHLEYNDYSQPIKSVMPGTEVTADKLKVDKETFESYVERGLVRDMPYPDIPDDVSPSEHFAEQDSLMRGNQLEEEEVEEVEARQEAQAKAAFTAYEPPTAKSSK